MDCLNILSPLVSVAPRGQDGGGQALAAYNVNGVMLSQNTATGIILSPGFIIIHAGPPPPTKPKPLSLKAPLKPYKPHGFNRRLAQVHTGSWGRDSHLDGDRGLLHGVPSSFRDLPLGHVTQQGWRLRGVCQWRQRWHRSLSRGGHAGDCGSVHGLPMDAGRALRTHPGPVCASLPSWSDS